MIWTINSIDSKLFLGSFDKVLSRSSKIYVMKRVKLPLLQWDVLFSFLSFSFTRNQWNTTFHIYTLSNVCQNTAQYTVLIWQKFSISIFHRFFSCILNALHCIVFWEMSVTLTDNVHGFKLPVPFLFIYFFKQFILLQVGTCRCVACFKYSAFCCIIHTL